MTLSNHSKHLTKQPEMIRPYQTQYHNTYKIKGEAYYDF